MRKSRSSGKQTSRANKSRGPIPLEDEIYQLITRGIVTKQIRPGTRIKEAALAEQFGVSRSRVRRVLHRLSELDVVEFRLNFGAVVCRPSPEDARGLFRTRLVLECEAVAAATRTASKASFARLRESIQQEKRAFRDREPGVAALSSQFHLLVGEACGNRVLARLLVPLVHRSVLVQSLYERSNQDTICLAHEHSEIVDLMERGRAAAAVKAMAEHIAHIEASLDYELRDGIDTRLDAALI